MYVCIYIYIYIYVCVYIYIYRERERYVYITCVVIQHIVCSILITLCYTMLLHPEDCLPPAVAAKGRSALYKSGQTIAHEGGA